MPLAEISPLEARSQMVIAGNGDRILHVTFVGEHHRSHGVQMQSRLQDAVASERPLGVLIDLLKYEYEFGNDVSVLFLAGWHRKSKTLVPTCIVAIGKTRASLESLYRAGSFELEPYLSFAESAVEALAWLSKALDAPAFHEPDKVR